MLRVGILDGGVENSADTSKPIRKLYVVEESLY